MATFTERLLILVLEFTWLSCCAGTDRCDVTVTQPQFMEAYNESSNITISCTFTAQSCPTSSLNILWFRYLAQTHEDLCTPMCNNSSKFKVLQPAKDQTSLQINNPGVEDSAIYYCGIAFSHSSTTTSKKTGAGTLLVIRVIKEDKIYYSQGINIMVAVSLLLFLYLTAILGISKFFSKPKLKRSEKEDLRGMHNVCAKGSKEAICQAIAKELYKKKHKRKFWPGSLANRRARDEPS
ncbi:immunoglobulin superfamily member 6 [Sceloporus undulatus]|uniref:immunoglobulin superfamily member 6 n=1 Tax=Sceloporus undulatus TaxID=8520 RepID=UPI001C4AF4B1|nr:immunoglobulin superfamily member 6 [Sceloporus undulatus]